MSSHEPSPMRTGTSPSSVFEDAEQLLHETLDGAEGEVGDGSTPAEQLVLLTLAAVSAELDKLHEGSTIADVRLLLMGLSMDRFMVPPPDFTKQAW